MILELKIEKWLKAGLARYAANPVLVAKIFHDDSYVGTPTALAEGLLADATQRWIPEEFVGGEVVWSDVRYPILHNSGQRLLVLGDTSTGSDPQRRGYTILPPETARLTKFLQTETFTVLTAFAQVPTQLPAFSIRLQQDSQGDAAVGSLLDQVMDPAGTEQDINRLDITGSYLISIWTRNRIECLWLYAFLTNLYVGSQQQFATWGLAQVTMAGSDLDPSLAYLPEQGHVRHFLLTAMRPELAANLLTLDYIDTFGVTVYPEYARLPFVEPLP